MALALILAATLWFGGKRFGVPARTRGIALFALYAVFVLLSLVAAPGSGLRALTGGRRANGWSLAGSGC